MIVRDVGDPAVKVVAAENRISRHILLQADGMGYSLHRTTLKAGETTCIHHRNHFEVIYCLDGKGSITDLAGNQAQAITPGTCCVLGCHDRRLLTAISDMTVLCVFTPPLSGDEAHGEQGS